MADTVQFFMEEMVPELEDLEKKGVFTREEIRSIVKKRQNFEYKIKRRRPQKVDFVKYIEYEKALERLRRKRKDRKDIEKSASDHAILKRLHFIYGRAVRKFKHDIPLWLEYIAFGIAHGSKASMKKLLARGLEANPKSPVLWIKAACWEYDACHSMKAARVLFMRGLRLNDDALDLWLEYFRLELLYCKKLLARRKILGVGKPSKTVTPKKKGKAAAAEDDSNEDDPMDTGDTPAADDKTEQTLRTAAIPRAVFRNAVSKNPGNLDFRIRFVGTCTELGAGPAALDDIYDSITRDFPADARAQAALCLRPWHELQARERAATAAAQQREAAGANFVLGGEEVAAPAATEEGEDAVPVMPTDTERREVVQAVIKGYEDAIAEVASTELWTNLLEFVAARVRDAEASEQEKLHAQLLARLLAMYARCHEAHLLSAAGYMEYTRVLASLPKGTIEAALRITTEGTAAHPADAPLWLLRIRLAGRGAEGKALRDTVVPLYRQAVKTVKPDDSLDLWNGWLDALVENGADAEEVETTFKLAVRSPCAEVASLFIRYITWAHSEGGLKRARTVYTTLLAAKGRTVEVFRHCAAIEEASNIDARRRLYELAVAQFGAEANDIWLEYIRMEQETGNMRSAAGLYQRALGVVSDVASFTAAYNEQTDVQ